MKRRVEWSEDALADLLDQVAHIAADNPDAADDVAAKLRAAGSALGAFATGHPGRVQGVYENTVRGLPYIIAYALTDDEKVVSILRLIHTARNWTDERWPAA